MLGWGQHALLLSKLSEVVCPLLLLLDLGWGSEYRWGVGLGWGLRACLSSHSPFPRGGLQLHKQHLEY